MENQLCLNCSSQVHGKFCANCGQKTNTHRITMVHFIAHDLLHGTFHFDRGILFTLKEALVRPGRAALDYIGGKRIRYYNVFYLSLILIGVVLILSHSGNENAVEGADESSREAIDFFTKNIKLIVLGFVPLLAINSKILFWKLKLNLAEHFIVGGFTFVGVLAMMNLFVGANTIVQLTSAGEASEYVLLVLLLAWLLFPFWAYCNLAWKTHSVLGILWRLVAFYILLFVELITITGLVLWLVTGKTDMVIS